MKLNPLLQSLNLHKLQAKDTAVSHLIGCRDLKIYEIALVLMSRCTGIVTFRKGN